MAWRVEFHPTFLGEFQEFSGAVQDEIAALIRLLGVLGPQLGRPRCDTLKGSKHAHRRQRRLAACVRVRSITKAVLLVAASKSGVSEARFYKRLIRLADERFDQHIGHLKKQR